MISDEKLAKLSLVLAAAGIVSIYLSIALIGPQETAIGEIDTTDIGKQVSVAGTVNSFNTKDGNIFITLGDGTGNITIVMFERTARGQRIELNEHDYIEVEGQVNVYKNELEIIANSISKG